MTPADIVNFWFSEKVSQLWFQSTPEFDAELRSEYASTLDDAVKGNLPTWAETATGSLALVILLDQFPLNMYRGQARSFASEADAIVVAKKAIDLGQDQQLDLSQRAFLYLPMMHSENLADQDYSVRLFQAPGLESNLRFAQHHRGIIERFGRFPHRNAILGRENTPDETTYLESKEGFHG